MLIHRRMRDCPILVIEMYSRAVRIASTRSEVVVMPLRVGFGSFMHKFAFSRTGPGHATTRLRLRLLYGSEFVSVFAAHGRRSSAPTRSRL